MQLVPRFGKPVGGAADRMVKNPVLNESRSETDSSLMGGVPFDGG